MSSSVPSMPLPICLIENVGGNTLVFNEKAKKILLEISQPVVVIAIIGRYRTGKSYLMNKLAGKKNGFALGSSIQSETKGIWMWCVPHPQNPEHTLILLESEGLGDVEKGDCKNDAWIFSLAFLLSSAFVFNCIATIDQQSMEQLHYVTELTNLIKLKSSPDQQDETGEYKRVFPSFTWCVRDFTLPLEKNGKEITADEYLMSSLHLREGFGQKVKNYNLPRECILHYFHTHKCFVFERPASTRNLQRLEELEESDLEEDFVEQAAKFYNYMMTNSHVKTLAGGHKVTGRMLATLADSYVKAIQSETVPCMENAVLALTEIENMAAVQEGLAKYECEMDKRVLKFPTENQQEFLNMHMECEKEALKVFMGRLIKDDEDQNYQRQLKEQIDKKMYEYSAKNEKASTDFCKKLLQELSVTMENNIQTGEYAKPGGHNKYLMEKVRIMEGYVVKPGKGIKALEVMQQYTSEKKDIEAAIIQADNTLTEKEKQLAEERAQTEIAKRDREIMEQNNRYLQERMEDQKRSFEQHKRKEQENMKNQQKISDLTKDIETLQENSKKGLVRRFWNFIF